MKAIILIGLLTIYNSFNVISQQVYIDSSNYHFFLDLENLSLNESLKGKLNFEQEQLFSNEIEIKKFVEQEFKVKKSLISKVRYVHNKYFYNDSMLSLGFVFFSFNKTKEVNRLLCLEKKKQYKNFKLPVLTKYFLLQYNYGFLVIFSETPHNKIIEKLFYPSSSPN